MAFLDTAGLERLWQQIIAKLGTKADASSISTLQSEIDEHSGNTNVHITSAERTKLSGIETGAQKNTVTGIKGDSESSYRTGNVNITAANIGLGNVNNTSDDNKPVSTAQQSAIDAAKSAANTYTDEKIANLLDNSTDAVDSIMELAEAMETNTDAIDALRDIAAGKANASHTHGNITNAGAIGTAANKAVITTTNGVLTTGTVPVASGGTGSTTAAGALTNLGLTATAAEINKLDGVTATTAEINYLDGVTSSIQSQLDSKAATHSHPYAGSSTQGGSATSAVKLDSSAGSTTQPVWFENGKPVATTYTLGKSVPSDAKFTDTTYSDATTSASGLMSIADKIKLDNMTPELYAKSIGLSVDENGDAIITWDNHVLPAEGVEF